LTARHSFATADALASVRGGGRYRNSGARSPLDFSRISGEMAQIAAFRDAIIMDAFAALEERYALLAQMLIAHFGGRSKAAKWMSWHQPFFEGRTGYDVIVAGEVDVVWDKVTIRAICQWS
jgi:hypothetical protein